MDENQKSEQISMDVKVLTKGKVVRKLIHEYMSGKYTEEEYDLLCQEMSYEILKSRMVRI